MKRVIWIVYDSVGCGDLPDSKEYGDYGCHTLGHTWQSCKGLDIPNLISLGLGNIEGMIGVTKENNPKGAYARAEEISKGKDTTTGHFEMIGVYGKQAFPTYPNGFPKEIIDSFVEKCGIPGVLGNCTASGTEIIERLGREHEATGKPIVYTSADSVFQIAACEEIYPPEKLYEMCKIAREILTGEHGVGRVIARPYVNVDGKPVRTANRRDFSLKPKKENLLNFIKDEGMSVAAVGKIEDIFAKAGITDAIHTRDNADGMERTLEYMDSIDRGLIFTNLVEFDSKWGHRRDAKGYGLGLEQADVYLGEIIKKMKKEDILVINADHGCDPTAKGTDHTREYIPVLVYGESIKAGVNMGTLKSFADIGQTIAEYLELGNRLEIGQSFLDKIIKA